MDKLINEIRMHFASQYQGIRALTSLPNPFIAYSFRQGVEYGVAIKIKSDKDIYEESAQITIKTFVNLDSKYIALSCCDESFRNEFAIFGANFISPGDNGENRKIIVVTPLVWWNNWIGMLGNRYGTKKSYDTIAEMLALEELYKIDHTIAWTASHAGSHDIESDSKSFEVKSTVKKSDTTVTISSRFQLDSVKPLQLWFYRMEASEQGVSIDDIKKRLVDAGYSETIIESQLENRGFMLGNSSRSKRFVVLEKRKFIVDDNFPRIVESSFKNDVYPSNIVKILYTIDLEGLDYTG